MINLQQIAPEIVPCRRIIRFVLTVRVVICHIEVLMQGIGLHIIMN